MMSDINNLLDSLHQPGIDASTGMTSAISASMQAPGTVDEEISRILGVPTDAQREEMVRKYISGSPDPVGMSNEWEASKAYATIYNVSPFEVFGKSDVFAKDYFGKVVEPKTAARAVLDSWRSGVESMRQGLNAASYALAVMGGTQDTWQAQQAKKNMNDATQAMAQLGEDPTPRNWFVTGEKWIAQSLPYMGLMALSGGVAGGIAEGGAAIAGKIGADLAAKQIVRSVVAEGLNVLTGAAVMGGQDFATMVNSGIDEKAAARFSVVTGLINGAIEQVLGIEGMYAGVFTKTGLPSISSYLTKKAFANGLAPTIAAKTLLRVGMSMLSEPTEEGLQAFTSDTARLMAQSLQAEGTVTDPMTADKMGQDIAQNMWQAFVTAPFLGLLPNVVQSVKDVNALKTLAAVAPSMTKDNFQKAADASGALEGIPENEKEGVANTIWEHGQSVAQQVAVGTYQSAKAEANKMAADTEASGTSAEHRNAGGGLNVSQTSEGVQTGESMFVVSSPSTGERYGDVVVKDNGDHYSITEGDIVAGHEGMARELLQEVSATLGTDKPILIEDHVDPVITAAHEWMAENNPGGSEKGANWSTSRNKDDEMAASFIRAEASKTGFTTPGQAELLVTTMEMAAKAAGTTLAEVTAPFRASGMFSMDKSAQLMAAGKAGALAFTGKNGVSVDPAEAIKATKAVIYLAQNANFAAVVHEAGHYIRTIFANTEGMKKIEASYGVKNGVWTTAQEERFTNDYMTYRAQGSSPSVAHAGVFSQLSMWLRRLWKGGLSGMDLAPEVKQVFEQWDKEADAQQTANEAPATGIAPENGSEGTHFSPLIAASADPATGGETEALAETDTGAKAASIEAAAVQIRKDGIAKYQAAIKAGASNEELGRIKAENKLWSKGLWRDNPSMVARVKQAAGVELSAEEKALVFTAEIDAKDEGLGESEAQQSFLFMDTKDLKDAQQYVSSQDMADYDTFEDWQASLEQSHMLTDADKAFIKAQWDYAHDKSAVSRFKKPGDFTKFMASKGNMTEFLLAMADQTFNKRSRDETYNERRKRFLELISKTPQLKDIVDKLSATGGQAVATEEELKKAIAYTRKNESLVKLLYAEVTADEALTHEAIAGLKFVPEAQKRSFVTKPGMTMDDQAQILHDLRSDDIIRKVKAKTLGIGELLSYSKEVEAKHREELAVAKAKGKEDVADTKAYFREREALRKLRAHIQKQRRFIMAASTQSAMAPEYYRALKFIQDFIGHDGDKAKMDLKNLGSVVFTTDRAFMDQTLSFLDRFQGQPFEAYSVDELDEIAQRVDEIGKRGRKEYKAKHLAYGLEIKETRRQAEEALAANKGSKPILPQGSVDKEDQNRKTNRMRVLNYSAMRPDAFFSKYMGKWHYDKLFKERVEREEQEFRAYDERTNPVLDFIEKSKLHEKLFKEVNLGEIGGNDMLLTVTYSQLMGIRALVGTRTEFNQKQRDAFIYGNLYSAKEKDADGMVRDEQGAVQGPPTRGDEYMKMKYKAKLEAVLSVLEDRTRFTQDMEDAVKLMVDSTDDPGHWLRFSQAVMELTNREPSKEKFYFPIMREGVLHEGEDQIMDLLKNSPGGFGSILDTGMTLDRQADINPRNMKPVKIDAMKVYFDAISKQEHLINMGAYAKELHGIYMNNNFSGGVKEQIEASLGTDGARYLKEYIDTITNPTSWGNHGLGDGIMRYVRGAQVIGNLAWRWTTVLMQMTTSPLPFLSEVNPMELLAVAGEAYSSMHPIQWYKDIESKSSVLKHRQFEPAKIMLENMSEEGVEGVFRKFGQMGMNPIQFADRFSVAVGWEAVYRKHMKKLGSDTPENRLAAQTYANMVVKKTQPSAEDVDRSPLYRNMNSFKQIILQFTQPSNVIWNNIAYDMPMAIREKEYGKFMGMLTAYIMTGLCIGVIQALRGRGPEPDDEGNKDWLKYMTLAAGGQFFQSIPIVGDTAANILMPFITGEGMPMRSDNTMPLVNEVMMTIAAMGKNYDTMSEEKRAAAVEQGIWHAVTAMGLGAGAPVRAIHEYYNLVKGGVEKLNGTAVK